MLTHYLKFRVIFLFQSGGSYHYRRVELGTCETSALLNLYSFQLPSFVYLLEFHSSSRQVCIVVSSPWSFCGLFPSKQMYWAFSVAEMVYLGH